jgi:hypothetical protein
LIDNFAQFRNGQATLELAGEISQNVGDVCPNELVGRVAISQWPPRMFCTNPSGRDYPGGGLKIVSEHLGMEREHDHIRRFLGSVTARDERKQPPPGRLDILGAGGGIRPDGSIPRPA